MAEPSGLLLFAGGHRAPGAYTNGVIRTSRAAPGGDAVLAAANSFFASLHRGFAVWVRGDSDADLEASARAAGLWQRPPMGGNPGIAVTHPPDDQPPPAGVQIRHIHDEQGYRDYLMVVASAYGVAEVGPALAEAILFSIASLRSPDVAVFVAYADGVPLAGTMVYVAAGAAGLYWAATVPQERGRRVGRATFRAAWAAGFAMGATCAVSQASAVGAPNWIEMGFEVVTHYRRYLARPPKP